MRSLCEQVLRYLYRSKLRVTTYSLLTVKDILTDFEFLQIKWPEIR